VIIVKALWTAVTSQPFLNLLPLADEITTGFIALCFMIMGKPRTLSLVAATTIPAAALLRMKSRRFIDLLIDSSFWETVGDEEKRALIQSCKQLIGKEVNFRSLGGEGEGRPTIAQAFLCVTPR